MTESDLFMRLADNLKTSLCDLEHVTQDRTVEIIRIKIEEALMWIKNHPCGFIDHVSQKEPTIKEECGLTGDLFAGRDGGLLWVKKDSEEKKPVNKVNSRQKKELDIQEQLITSNKEPNAYTITIPDKETAVGIARKFGEKHGTDSLLKILKDFGVSNISELYKTCDNEKINSFLMSIKV
jgi:hypothetical protein